MGQKDHVEVSKACAIEECRSEVCFHVHGLWKGHEGNIQNKHNLARESGF